VVTVSMTAAAMETRAMTGAATIRSMSDGES
jgi:hypothetical protein